MEKEKRLPKEPINRINSKRILNECQIEAYSVRPWTRQSIILDIIGGRAMTAREICIELGEVDMNYVRPRLTELVNEGLIEVIGKAKDGYTNRSVSVFRRRDHEI